MKENLVVMLSSDTEDAKKLSKFLEVLQKYNNSIIAGESCLFKKDELEGLVFPVFDKSATLYFSPVNNDMVELKAINQKDHNAVMAKRFMYNILSKYESTGSIYMMVSSPSYDTNIDSSIVYDIITFNLGLLFKYDMDRLAEIGKIKDIKYITFSIYKERSMLRFVISNIDGDIIDAIKQYESITDLSKPTQKDIIKATLTNRDACFVQLVELSNELSDSEKMNIVKQILNKNCHAEIYATGNSRLSVEVFPETTDEEVLFSEYNIAPRMMSIFLDKFKKGELKDKYRLVFSVKEDLIDPDVTNYNLEFILNQELQLVCLLDEKVAGIFLTDTKTASQWISEGEAGISLEEITDGDKDGFRYFMMEFFNNIAMVFKKND